MTTHTSFPIVPYAYTVLGVLISIVLPLLRRRLPVALHAEFLLPANIAASAKTYIIVGAFSFVTAVLIVAVGGQAAAAWEWQTALLAGYAWDSTLQKIVHG